MLRNSSIATRWADLNEGGSGKKDSSRNGGMSFVGRTLYSRGTPLARYHTNPAGMLYVLATSTYYSMSTSNHLQQALRQVSVPFFRVPYIGISGGWSREPHDCAFDNVLSEDALWLAIQFNDQVNTCTAAWNKREHWRWGDADWRINLTHDWEHITKFVRFTGAKWTPKISLPDVLDAIEADRKARQTAWENPKAAAARERAKARKVALRALGMTSKAA
jgi:hypothetical protein